MSRDVVRTVDPALDEHPDRPFNFTRGWADSSTYLSQRQLFEQLVVGVVKEPLMVEESVVSLLELVVRSAYKTTVLMRPIVVAPKAARHRAPH
jgi:hypothetical protein